jgi:hypothetical protein
MNHFNIPIRVGLWCKKCGIAIDSSSRIELAHHQFNIDAECRVCTEKKNQLDADLKHLRGQLEEVLSILDVGSDTEQHLVPIILRKCLGK